MCVLIPVSPWSSFPGNARIAEFHRALLGRPAACLAHAPLIKPVLQVTSFAWFREVALPVELA